MFQFLNGLAEVITATSRVYEGLPAINGKKGRHNTIVEEEVLLCKNNVCVHVQTGESNRHEHHQPGYFTLKKIQRSTNMPDIILCWVPNSLLAAGIADSETPAVVEATEQNGELEQKEEPKKEDATGDPLGSVENETLNSEGVTLNSEGAGTVDVDEKGTHTDVDAIIHKLRSDVYLDTSDENENGLSTKCTLSVDLNQSPSRRAENFQTPYGDVFSISLRDMKTLKLFFTNTECTCGQFVVGNYENHYKVFHFHHNGLEKLSEIFSKWQGCVGDSSFDFTETRQKIFTVQRETKSPGKIKKESIVENFAEEGNYSAMNLSTWRGYLNPIGQIEDVNNFRKHIFFAGLSPEVRKEAWKFLLYCYPVQSTSFERDGPLKRDREENYKALEKTRLGLTGQEYEKFWKQVQFTVDKDVVRTDRSNPFYSGQDNPNVQKMRNILLDYAIYNPAMGYTQGMSDLLAPLLMVIEDEVETFWCFVGMMEFSMFPTTPTDNSMEKSLGFLKELLRLMYPEFYIHCLVQDEDLSLLFCHRWLVLCFRREFIDPETLTVWEACWSRYLTDYFHIFIAVAILCLYGTKCVDKKMSLDKMLEYFADMAMKFDGSAVLKKARSLLFKFRRLQAIPCTLEGLLCGPGIWDGGIAPEIECVSHYRRCCKDKKNVKEMDSEEGDKEEVVSKADKSDADNDLANKVEEGKFYSN